MATFWPDDEENNKKPRYSAETGARLLVKKSASRLPPQATRLLLTNLVDLDLENTKNDVFKLRERLDTITREREEMANKVRNPERGRLWRR